MKLGKLQIEKDPNWVLKLINLNCVENQIALTLFQAITHRDILSGVELDSEIVHIPEGDSYMAERKTCQLLGLISFSL